MTVPSYHPSPNPLPGTQMDAIQRAYQAGALTDQEMLACQDALFAPCVEHNDRPGKFIIDSYPRCTECAVRLHREGRA